MNDKQQYKRVIIITQDNVYLFSYLAKWIKIYSSRVQGIMKECAQCVCVVGGGGGGGKTHGE